MNNDHEDGLPGIGQIQEAVDTLFDELCLAHQWQKPSCMLAVYNSPSTHVQAMTALATELLSAGHSVYPVDASETPLADFEAGFSQDPDDRGVYFIVNISSQMDERELRLWRAFVYQRNTAHPRLARLVFWLSEGELVELVQNFHDFWENRYRVVDLTGGSVCLLEPEACASQTGPHFPSAPAAAGSDDQHAIYEREAREYLRDGLLEQEQGDHYNACQYLQNAADLADVVQDMTLQTECQQALAHTHASLRNFDLAVEACQRILQHKPTDRNTWNKLGSLYLRLDDMPQALQAYQQAVDLDANHPAAWEGLARVYHQFGLAEKSVGCFNRAIEIDPDFSDAWEGLGNILVELDRPELAVKAYQKALGHDPARTPAWISFARIYSRRGKLADARAILQKAVELQPGEIDLWLELGELNLGCNDAQAAVNAFTRALVICPRHGPAYCRLAEAHTRLGNNPIAISCYELGVDFIDDEPLRQASLEKLQTLKASECESEPPSEGTSISNWDEMTEFCACQTEVEPAEMPQEDADDWSGQDNPQLVPGSYDLAIQAYLAALDNGPADYWPYVQNLAVAYMKREKLTARCAPEPQAPFAEPEPELAQSGMPEFMASLVMEPELESAQTGMPEFMASLMMEPEPAETVVSRVVAAPVEAPAPAPAVENQASYAGWEPLGPPEKALKPGKRYRHLEADRLEELTGAAGRESNTLPAPIRNSREWAIYLKYSAPIISSWTQNERNKLLLDAVLEEPRADLSMPGNANPDGMVVTELAHMLATDANFEKSRLTAGRKSMLEVPALPATEEDEKWAEAWIRQGKFLVRKGAYEDAATAFAMAVSLAPRLGSTYTSLGLVYFHQERYQDALLQFMKSIELVRDPKEKAACWNYLGDSYRRLNDDVNAQQAYEKATELNQNGSPLKWRARNLILSNCR